jgi:CBS domain-containing protein
MSEDIDVIYDDMLVRQVAHLLLRDRVSGFPVVSQNIGMVGVITITDLFSMIHQASSGEGDGCFLDRINNFKNQKVADVMTKEVVSISPDTPIEEIVQTVMRRKIHFFPVVDQNRLVGIVSRHDILNAIFSYD